MTNPTQGAVSTEHYEDLKPCPFCGTEPWGLFGPCEHSGRFWIECNGPKNDAMECGSWYAHDNCTTKDQAAKEWNLRANPAPAPATLDKAQVSAALANAGLMLVKTQYGMRIEKALTGITAESAPAKAASVPDGLLRQALEALGSCGAAAMEDGGQQWYDDRLVSAAEEAIREFLEPCQWRAAK